MHTARNAVRESGVRYKRHQPELTLLYQIIETYYPEFLDYMESQGKALPTHIKKEFEAYLKCGRLEHGFIRVCCEGCHHERLVAFSCKKRGFCPSCGARRMAESAALLVDEILPHEPVRQLLPWMACSRAMQEQLPRVISFPYQLRYLFARYPKVMSQALAIVYRCIANHLIKKAGLTHKTAKTGGITLIQRFGSALNLNVHFHMLLLDGVYTTNRHGKRRFQYVRAPLSDELTSLVHTISHRIARFLERQGLLERDMEQSYLTLEEDDDPMSQIHGHSTTYRIAVGAQQGQKVFTLQTLPPSDNESNEAQIGQIAGFSLHAGIMARRDQRKKLERLCRYICRPAVSEKRLAMTSGGRIRYDVKGFTNVACAGMRRSDQLKTPYRDGTTHVFFQPLDFIARLAALVPKPRVNLTRFVRTLHDTHPLRGPAEAVQIHS